MNRAVLPELLDILPPDDAAALRSRRDLRRLNVWMNHPRIMARALQANLRGGEARQFAELGAGDGHFLLSVARRLNGSPAGSRAVLVDRLVVTDPKILEEFRSAGWEARTETSEAAEWLGRAPAEPRRIIITNLFFHQFEPGPLAEMLRLAAVTAEMVVALEPRRAWLPRLCGRLLWMIGCGPVTRHDANISIRAGFVGREISTLWPDPQNWRLTERRAGLFSHLFIAHRNA